MLGKSCQIFYNFGKYHQRFLRKFFQEFGQKFLQGLLQKLLLGSLRNFSRESLEIPRGISPGNALEILSWISSKIRLKVSSGIPSEIPLKNSSENTKFKPSENPPGILSEIHTVISSEIAPVDFLINSSMDSFGNSYIKSRDPFRNYSGESFRNLSLTISFGDSLGIFTRDALEDFWKLF